LLIQPDAWIGVEKGPQGAVLVQHDGQTMRDQRVPLASTKVWLRADCEYTAQFARFSYSTDGKKFQSIGEPFRMVGIGVTFQGVRYALFSYHREAGEAGFADFDSVAIQEPAPHGLTSPIPYGKQIALVTHAHEPAFGIVEEAGGIAARTSQSTAFAVVDQKLGRVALRGTRGFLSVGADGNLTVRSGSAGNAETFQWIETFTGELTLLSLETHRYVRVDFKTGMIHADSQGPEPDGPEGVRFAWRLAEPARRAQSVRRSVARSSAAWFAACAGPLRTASVSERPEAKELYLAVRALRTGRRAKSDVSIEAVGCCGGHSILHLGRNCLGAAVARPKYNTHHFRGFLESPRAAQHGMERVHRRGPRE
jgi:hypothetical protein